MIIDDKYIINTFWPNKICLINRKKHLLTKEIEDYLNSRYKFSESIKETLFCIKHNIDRDNLICPVCGNGILKFNYSKKRGYFSKGCCKECCYKIRDQHSIATSLEKYGVKYPRQNKEKNKEINKKRKTTCLEKYGVEEYSKTEEYKKRLEQTSLEKYGTKHPFQSEIVKKKIQETCKKLYNTDWTFQNELAKQHHKETLLKKYGVENSFNIPYVIDALNERKNEIQRKRDETKRKNKTFGTSIPEQKSYELLLTCFGKNDIIRQYKESRYPYNCDFYICSLDLFIECNYFWTHHGHYFDENDPNDIEELSKMFEKSKLHKFYEGAITVWTKVDLKKRETANKNKLNYKVFWNIDELKDWINNYEKNN